MGKLGELANLPRVSGLPWHGVNYFCTTRRGGISQGPWSTLNLGLHTGDEPDHVLENRRLLQNHLPGEPLWLEQVHGAEVFDADQGPEFFLTHHSIAPRADAAITTQANKVLAIMTADCLPIVLASADGLGLGLVHAGWRGLAAGVLERTLDALRTRAGVGVSWRAWIGPGISQRHFEVGSDVFAAFVDEDPLASVFFVEKVAGSKWMADLPGLARFRLHKAGVRNIELSGYCTFSEPETFYSYRREPQTGRMVTLAWLNGIS
ncbi:peptidoglycan editing factor PgeF [Candidimonas sp. SYP-B2681]|uniref:peptidoglycan editing factor PgeF n=1 Tax=Candidimonas sp. SYP-B2681 TaxID=2497686 RepID=UPI000F868DDB|nr:peptidoglycan editing factor PgeF [Candidimonas sp. SYP-B2681]RTZ44488.1 peptidoglycan editing factor PgeF [Candidimonas sp. SYP-B2681]